jgi:RimJ/RimL family protein N-acetyltransferase
VGQTDRRSRSSHAAEELTTERLTMRRPAAADLGAIFAITADPRTTAHNPSDAIGTRRDARELYSRWNEQWDQYGFGYWVLRRHGSDLILGFCGLKVMPFRGGWVLNLFYRLAPSAWGHGIAGEAAAAAVAWAAANVPQWTVIARVRPRNTASQRVALKAGLVRAQNMDGDGYDGIDWIYASPPAR